MIATLAARTLRAAGLLAYRSSPFVFGVGLSKTGTTSLGVALELLGFRHKSYDLDLLEKWYLGEVEDVFRGMSGYSSFEDLPYPLMYDEVMRRYGRSARYVLTVRRSPETWLKSMKTYAIRQPPDRARYRKMAYGFEYPHQDEAAHIKFYNKHIVSVRAAAARHDVSDLMIEVCWERNDGWAELCSLLNIPPPRAKFPHKNKDKGRVNNLAYMNINRQRIAHLTRAIG